MTVDRATTLTLDARAGKPMKLTAPDSRARLVAGGVLVGARGDVPAHDYAEFMGLGDNTDMRRSYYAQVGPSVPAESFISQAGGLWQRGNGEVYNLVTTRKGGFFTGLTHTFTTRGLAKVVTPVGSNAKGSTAAPGSSWSTPGWPGPTSVLIGAQAAYRTVPNGSLTQYMSTEGGLRWNLSMAVGTADDMFLSLFYSPESRRYEPGRTYHEPFNTAVFGPATSNSTRPGDVGAVRQGSDYLVCLPLLSDAAGHGNSSDAKTRFRLTSGATTIIDLDRESCSIPLTGLLPRKAGYRLAVDASRPAGTVTVGSRASAVWTFTSAPAADNRVQRLPLSVVRFTPKLSLTGTAKAGTRITVPVRLQGPAAAKGAVKSLKVQVSYDGGRTWKTATVHTAADGSRQLTLTHPARATTIGFKATLVDRDGNTVSETLPTAYRTVN
ncbi:hypothetical protein ACFY1L_52975 [Streptomyces sp. NPDC001663]|uniref:hypothetical protein n=1 Tax=Streptomyces sp. NPDC001663 TaxID=3364597 RepID=UPI00369CAEBE